MYGILRVNILLFLTLRCFVLHMWTTNMESDQKTSRPIQTGSELNSITIEMQI